LGARPPRQLKNSLGLYWKTPSQQVKESKEKESNKRNKEKEKEKKSRKKTSLFLTPFYLLVNSPWISGDFTKAGNHFFPPGK
jgi:hypothetical protein